MENQESAPSSAPQVVPPQSSPRSHKSWPLLLAGLVLGAGVAGAVWYFMLRDTAPVPAPQTSASDHRLTPPGTVPSCTADNVSLSVGTSEGTAGTIYQHMVVTNKGAKTCTLTGYPLVTLHDATGGVLGSAATPGAAYPIVTVTLAAGAKAHTAVGFPQAGNFDPGVCSADSANIWVYLPGSASYVYAALAKPYCPGF